MNDLKTFMTKDNLFSLSRSPGIRAHVVFLRLAKISTWITV